MLHDTSMMAKQGAGGSKVDPKKGVPKDPKEEEKAKKKQEKEMSSEEMLGQVELMPIERLRLNHVFNLLCQASGNPKEEKYFDADDLQAILAKDKLNYQMSKKEIDLMIWDVDENLDEKVNEYEFLLMYKRCITDETGLEPKALFNLVQFLMYDKREAWKITEEDTLELLYVRTKEGTGEARLEELNEEIKKIFGKDNDERRKQSGQEKEITFAEFLEERNKLALKQRKEAQNLKRSKKSTLSKAE